MRVAALLVLALLGFGRAEEPAAAAAPEEPGLELAADAAVRQPYLGISWSPVQDVPAESGFTKAVALNVVVGPAAEAGLQVGDRLVQIGDAQFGDALVGADATAAGEVIRAAVIGAGPGGTLRVKVLRDGALIERPVTVGARPPRFDTYTTPAAMLTDTGADTDPESVKLLAGATAAAQVEAAYADTLARLAATENHRDVFRLRDVTRAHVAPAATEKIAARISAGAAADPLAAAAQVLVPWEPALAPAPAPPALADLDAAVAYIAQTLDAALDLHTQAFAGLSDDERASLGKLTEWLGSRLEESVYLHDDEDSERMAASLRLVEIAPKVRLAPLLAAARQLQSLTSESFIELLAKLARAHANAGAPVIVQATCKAGAIVIAGTGNDTVTEDAAFRFDLGGNDRTRDCGAGALMGKLPIAILVDLGGDDLYAASTEGNLSAAIGGISILVDCAGDDQYVARRWGLGAAVLGVSVLDDRAGNDTYRIEELGIALAFCGAGLLVDRAGSDRYNAHHLAQGVGMGRGFGALVDLQGDDEFACTGRSPSSYGEAGTFDGWGQGLGLGFRTVTSGGIGLLLDRAGTDRYEAGNFSQGGGYFFGMGILEDGAGDDRYIGSRYAQGFAAHQAIGVLIERAGNDRYQSHHDVAHGLSWDETMVVLHDYSGNDVYEASGFSLCRVAHNGVAIVLEDAGDDTYLHDGSPGGSSGNDYHGGTSFGVFVDSSGNDTYRGRAANDSYGYRPEHAVFLDLPTPPKRWSQLDWSKLTGTNVFAPPSDK